MTEHLAAPMPMALSGSTPLQLRVCVRTASSEVLAAFLRSAGRGRYAPPAI